MKEVKINDKVSVQPINKEAWSNRLEQLSGEDKKSFLKLSNHYKELGKVICKHLIGLSKNALTKRIQAENPEFNPDADVIMILMYGRFDATSLKTSAEWILEEEFKDLTVTDPDGWDRMDFEFSWNEEKITRQQFIERLGKSTVVSSQL